MEHKVITGGEQWLPFARSRIKALRATGLAYASQKFEVEGALVEVRIEPGHEYIRIAGGTPEAYLETGQLNWSFHGLGDPLWAEAATWKFMDIPTSSAYLGKIVAGGPEVGKQKNDPALVEGQYSLAIGYPRSKSESAPERETKDKKTEADYKDSTLSKKGIMSMYPASIFSGKMRLFMQSIYGAKEPEKKEDLPFIFDPNDIVPVGMFKDKKGGGMLRIRPESMGIFTAPDNTYWLLDINSGPGKVLVNKVNADKVAGLVKSLSNGADRTKTEAYIFANSYIEIPIEQSKQLWANGSFQMAPGSELAYGWKWNIDGSKASIVVHEMRGDTIPTTRLHAYTVHLTFTYAKQDDEAKCPISVSAEILDHGDWIDGWGEYNIFVPETPAKTAPLDLFSIRAGSGLIPPLFPFKNIPIYGYYVNDVWTQVLLTANEDYESKTDSSVTNLQYAYGQTFPHTEKPLEGTYWHNAEGVWTSTWLTTVSGPGRSVTFDGVTVDGRHKSFTGQDEWGSVSHDDYGSLGGFGYLYGWPLDNPTVTDAPANTGFPRSALCQAAAAAKAANPDMGISQTDSYGNTERGKIDVSGGAVTLFTIVIPGGDAEALYIARKIVDERVRTQRFQTYFTKVGLHVYQWRTTPPPAIKHIKVADGAGWAWAGPGLVDAGTTTSYMNSSDTWIVGPPATVTITSLPPDPPKVDVYCFNKTEHGLMSTPGGSYAGLFDVDYRYPQYDRGMYTFTSYGGRYIMSEQAGGPRKNPSSVKGNRFVGWA